MIWYKNLALIFKILKKLRSGKNSSHKPMFLALPAKRQSFSAEFTPKRFLFSNGINLATAVVWAIASHSRRHWAPSASSGWTSSRSMRAALGSIYRFGAHYEEEARRWLHTQFATSSLRPVLVRAMNQIRLWGDSNTASAKERFDLLYRSTWPFSYQETKHIVFLWTARFGANRVTFAV